MICKGGTRSHPNSLAHHLLKTDNERVVVVELKHTASQNLKDALDDMHATIAMTEGKKSLYHAQINPAKGEQMTPDQWKYAVDEMEKRLGFTDQPRAVVYHEKKGRPHIHVIWQRTDVKQGKVIETSNDYYIHKELGRHLEREFHHKILKAEFGKNWEYMDERTQVRRDGYNSAKQLRGRIRPLWKKYQDPKEFIQALKKIDFEIAKGRRGVVIVSKNTQIYSLMRCVGEKKKNVDERLKEVYSKLSEVEQVKQDIRHEKQQEKSKNLIRQNRLKTFSNNKIISKEDLLEKSAEKMKDLIAVFNGREIRKNEFENTKDEIRSKDKGSGYEYRR